jgi:hypothetical protein
MDWNIRKTSFHTRGKATRRTVSGISQAIPLCWPCPLSERKSDSTPGEAWPRGTRPWGIVFLTQYRFLGRLAPCPIAHFHALEKGRWLRPASSFVACRSPFVLRLSSFVVRLPPPFKPATFCPERTIMHHAYNLPIPS